MTSLTRRSESDHQLQDGRFLWAKECAVTKEMLREIYISWRLNYC